MKKNYIWVVEIMEKGRWKPINQGWFDWERSNNRHANELLSDIRRNFPEYEYRKTKYSSSEGE